jgi:hypothetical protein
MIHDEHAALFLMLGQIGERTIRERDDTAPGESLALSPAYDLAPLLPDRVRSAIRAAETYKFLFVFEGYLREFVVEALSKDPAAEWWSLIPPDVQGEVEKLEDTEEAKSWMALGSRDKSALMTYPQLLRVIEHCWKTHFEEIVRDKALVQEARLIGHLRNTICHMTEISEEEDHRIRQTMRDWFRVVAP